MVSPVPNLPSELGDVYVDLLSGPAKSVGNEQDKSLRVLSTKKLSKLTYLFELGVFGKRVQGLLSRE
jgi:hypothetical protein